MRLLLIAAVLSILALTGLVRADVPASHAGDPAPGWIGSQPTPESEPPAIVRAASTTAVDVPAAFAFESGRVHRAARRVVALGFRLPDLSDRRSGPRPFPLLI
jgi:hypothetical protein